MIEIANRQIFIFFFDFLKKNIRRIWATLYLQSLSATEATNYSLWKATNSTYQQTPHSSPLKMNNGCWARHLAEVFKPHPRQASISDDSNIIAETDESSTMFRQK